MGVRDGFDGDDCLSYIEAGRGLDTSFKQRGNCHFSRRTPAMERAWTQTRSETGYNPKLEQLALASCHICPVQWECCAYAIATQSWTWKEAMWTFIYAVRPRDRMRLARHENWREMLAEAKAHAMPVAIVVKRLKLAEALTQEEESCNQLAV